jgi:hypothetical protein
MLTMDTPTGPVVALQSQEQRIRNLSDVEFCAELNSRPCDPFLFSAWLQGARRDVINYDGFSTFTLACPGKA